MDCWGCGQRQVGPKLDLLKLKLIFLWPVGTKIFVRLPGLPDLQVRDRLNSTAWKVARRTRWVWSDFANHLSIAMIYKIHKKIICSILRQSLTCLLRISLSHLFFGGSQNANPHRRCRRWLAQPGAAKTPSFADPGWSLEKSRLKPHFWPQIRFLCFVCSKKAGIFFQVFFGGFDVFDVSRSPRQNPQILFHVCTQALRCSQIHLWRPRIGFNHGTASLDATRWVTAGLSQQWKNTFATTRSQTLLGHKSQSNVARPQAEWKLSGPRNWRPYTMHLNCDPWSILLKL